MKALLGPTKEELEGGKVLEENKKLKKDMEDLESYHKKELEELRNNEIKEYNELMNDFNKEQKKWLN